MAEIARGSLKRRETAQNLLDGLAGAPAAGVDEFRRRIEESALLGRGVGQIDVGLVASCPLFPRSRLWTGGERFAVVAREFGLAFDPANRKAAYTQGAGGPKRRLFDVDREPFEWRLAGPGVMAMA